MIIKRVELFLQILFLQHLESMAERVDVKYSPKFLKSASRLPKKLVALADGKEALFKEAPFHPSLKTHALHGKDKGAWAFWINQKYRIKFTFINPKRVLFLDVGTHDIYE